MNVDLFDYELPESLIAQTPLKERSKSRLLALNKKSGAVTHTSFERLIDYLHPGDLLVLNDTRVIPARLYGSKEDTGAKAELLLLKPLGGDRWEALVRPGKRLRKGARLVFPAAGEPSSEGAAARNARNGGTRALLRATIEDEGEMGKRIVSFEYEGDFSHLLDRIGQMPLPPYIKERLQERERYQTVYAKHEGSAAAPTAGLHFTQSFLEELADKGIGIAYVTLHVGLGTFRSVTADDITEHQMHEEYYCVPPETADAVNRAKASGKRVVAVGTTSARTLETAARAARESGAEEGRIAAGAGWTDLFIYPGVPFLTVDALLTNFHLPKSTLLMLVSAMAGRERVLDAYREAVRLKYRFFSFGDAMFIYE